MVGVSTRSPLPAANHDFLAARINSLSPSSMQKRQVFFVRFFGKTQVTLNQVFLQKEGTFMVS